MKRNLKLQALLLAAGISFTGLSFAPEGHMSEHGSEPAGHSAEKALEAQKAELQDKITREEQRIKESRDASEDAIRRLKAKLDKNPNAVNSVKEALQKQIAEKTTALTDKIAASAKVLDAHQGELAKVNDQIEAATKATADASDDFSKAFSDSGSSNGDSNPGSEPATPAEENAKFTESMKNTTDSLNELISDSTSFKNNTIDTLLKGHVDAMIKDAFAGTRMPRELNIIGQATESYSDDYFDKLLNSDAVKNDPALKDRVEAVQKAFDEATIKIDQAKNVEAQKNQLVLVDKAIEKITSLTTSNKDLFSESDIRNLDDMKDKLANAGDDRNAFQRLFDAFMKAFREIMAKAKEKLSSLGDKKNNSPINEEFDDLSDMQEEFEKARTEAAEREANEQKEAEARAKIEAEEAAARAEANKTPTQRAFDTLGIDMTTFDALDESEKLNAIKKAYKKEALANHPDKFSAEPAEVQTAQAEKFKAISNAFDRLKKIYS